MYEAQIDKLVHELWRVLHFPAELMHFLLNSFCLTHVRDGNTYVQTHAIPKSSSDTARVIACRGYKRPNKRSVRHHKGMTTADEGFTQQRSVSAPEIQCFCDSMTKV